MVQAALKRVWVAVAALVLAHAIFSLTAMSAEAPVAELTDAQRVQARAILSEAADIARQEGGADAALELDDVAAGQALVGEFDAALQTLRDFEAAMQQRDELSKTEYRQPPCSYMQSGFVFVAEQLAQEGRAKQAIAWSCNREAPWSDSTDAALKSVACALAVRGDGEGADVALAQVAEPEEAILTRIEVAIRLGRKAEAAKLARELLAPYQRGTIKSKDPSRPDIVFTPSDWSGNDFIEPLTGLISLHWAGEGEEAERILTEFARDVEDPEAWKEELREEIRDALEDITEEDDGTEQRPSKESKVVQSIAAQAVAGQIEAALESAAKIVDSDERIRVLRAAAIAVAAEHDEEATSKLFHAAAQAVEVDHSGQRWVAYAWARHGSADAAIEWARGLTVPKRKASALVGIARAIMEVGEP